MAGSVFEFRRLIPLLTEHFTVIAPSLPGYTLSDTPGMYVSEALQDIADLYAVLMTDVLGYTKDDAVQGGDWGAFVASVMALRYPAR